MELSEEITADLKKLIIGYLAGRKLLSPDEKVVVELKVEKGFNDELSELLQRPISEIGLSNRAFNALDERGVKTVAELLDLGIRNLLCTRHLGRKSARECRDKLRDLGFKLGPQWRFPGYDRWEPDF